MCTCFIFYVAMDGRNNEEKKIWIVWCVFLWVFSQLTNHKPQAFSSCVVRRLVDPFLPSCHIGSYPMIPWVCSLRFFCACPSPHKLVQHPTAGCVADDGSIAQVSF